MVYLDKTESEGVGKRMKTEIRGLSVECPLCPGCSEPLFPRIPTAPPYTYVFWYCQTSDCPLKTGPAGVCS